MSARAFVTGLGVCCPAGADRSAFARALFGSGAERYLAPPTIFAPGEYGLPAGQIPSGVELDPGLPRTHALALRAAREALASSAAARNAPGVSRGDVRVEQPSARPGSHGLAARNALGVSRGDVRVAATPHNPVRAQAAEPPSARPGGPRPAVRNAPGVPPIDAVVMGCTTGGMPHTEALMISGALSADGLRLHGTGTVAELVAREIGCSGPALTVSTACSSSAAALAMALAMIRSGRVRCVLAGGADALCRLTCFGFALLKLVDPEGARPFDARRAGMSVAEAAACLVLEAAESAPPGALAELCGAGLSCDAFHETAPHPEGDGALAAMRAALRSAGLQAAEIDYLNLHGTGTPDNDRSEARAVLRLFADIPPPPLSSIKGLCGHSLAAAGALDALACVEAIAAQRIPAHRGMRECDPSLGLRPQAEPVGARLTSLLSSSFGFGGSNAVLVLRRPDAKAKAQPAHRRDAVWIARSACLTGAGDLAATLARLERGQPCAGRPQVALRASGRQARRLARLGTLALALGEALAGQTEAIEAVFFGTAWGPQTETWRFLERLFASAERLSSPADFVSSVHSAPAGRLAMRYGARGPQITATCGAVSFEQAVLSAGLLAPEGAALLLGADEHHAELTPLLQPPDGAAEPADGGGGLLVSARPLPGSPALRARCLGDARASGALDTLRTAIARACPAVLLHGSPAAERALAGEQLDALVRSTGFSGLLLDENALFGDFATCSAAACAVAAEWARRGELMIGSERRALDGAVGLVSLGRQLAFLELGGEPG
ncbi:MAG: beta-ketoacyl synthase chain length factor [Deltaproteobacteria bacterium]|nr:beta-ketoacyl synthase chain length factor [Deltaproteobacteria bacterium]